MVLIVNFQTSRYRIIVSRILYSGVLSTLNLTQLIMKTSSLLTVCSRNDLLFFKSRCHHPGFPEYSEKYFCVTFFVLY